MPDFLDNKLLLSAVTLMYGYIVIMGNTWEEDSFVRKVQTKLNEYAVQPQNLAYDTIELARVIIVTAVINPIVYVFTETFAKIRAVFNFMWDVIVAVWNLMLEIIVAVWDFIYDNFAAFCTFVKEWAVYIWEKIDLFERIKDAWTVIRKVVNCAIITPIRWILVDILYASVMYFVEAYVQPEKSLLLLLSMSLILKSWILLQTIFADSASHTFSWLEVLFSIFIPTRTTICLSLKSQ